MGSVAQRDEAETRDSCTPCHYQTRPAPPSPGRPRHVVQRVVHRLWLLQQAQRFGAGVLQAGGLACLAVAGWPDAHDDLRKGNPQAGCPELSNTYKLP